jgi:hypothetical protein
MLSFGTGSSIGTNRCRCKDDRGAAEIRRSFRFGNSTRASASIQPPLVHRRFRALCRKRLERERKSASGRLCPAAWACWVCYAAVSTGSSSGAICSTDPPGEPRQLRLSPRHLFMSLRVGLSPFPLAGAKLFRMRPAYMKFRLSEYAILIESKAVKQGKCPSTNSCPRAAPPMRASLSVSPLS